MSEVISKAAKVAFYVILVAGVLAFIPAVLSALVAFSSVVGISFPDDFGDYLLTGRRVVNNFIYPNLFNVCIAFWFTGSSAVIGKYALNAIGSKIAGIN